MFQVKAIHHLSIWGYEISNFSQSNIEDLLKNRDKGYRKLKNNIIRCDDLELQFHFGANGILDEVYFAC